MSGDAEFVGGASFVTNPNNNTVVINIPEILNDTTSTTTGSLQVDLWYSLSPYTGGAIYGYTVASVPYTNLLGPRQYFSPSTITEPFNDAPGGSYYAVLTLEEYNNGYAIDSYLDLNPISSNPPSPTTSTPPPTSTTVDVPHRTETFAYPESDYTIDYIGNGAAIVTPVSPAYGSAVTSTNNEVLQFSDKPYFIESGDGANIARLYSAGLGRIPDPTGLFGWANYYADNVTATAKSQGVYVALAETSGGFNGNLSIADGIILSPEFISKYGALSNAQFVTQLYENVLGRAPDQTGLAGWLNYMSPGNSSGTVYTRAMVLVGFAESPENITKASSWLTDMSRSG